MSEVHDDYFGRDRDAYRLVRVKRWWVPDPVFKYLGPLSLLLGLENWLTIPYVESHPK